MHTFCPKCKGFLTIQEYNAASCKWCGTDLVAARRRIRAIITAAGFGVIAVVTLLVILSNSRPGPRFDMLMGQQVSVLEQLAEAVERHEPGATVDKLNEQLGELDREMAAIELSQTDKDQIIERYRGRISIAVSRLQKAGRFTVTEDRFKLAQ